MKKNTERNRAIAAAYRAGTPVKVLAREYGMYAANIYPILKREGVATGKRGWCGDPEGHRRAGKIGGKVVSQNREHMAAIGRRGGAAVSQDRAHMAEIGRKGGQGNKKPAA